MQVLYAPGARVPIRGCEMVLPPSRSQRHHALWDGSEPGFEKSRLFSKNSCASSLRRMTRSPGPHGSREPPLTDQHGTNNITLFDSSHIKK